MPRESGMGPDRCPTGFIPAGSTSDSWEDCVLISSPRTPIRGPSLNVEARPAGRYRADAPGSAPFALLRQVGRAGDGPRIGVRGDDGHGPATGSGTRLLVSHISEWWCCISCSQPPAPAKAEAGATNPALSATPPAVPSGPARPRDSAPCGFPARPPPLPAGRRRRCARLRPRPRGPDRRSSPRS